jgi:hypothetical protein
MKHFIPAAMYFVLILMDGCHENQNTQTPALVVPEKSTENTAPKYRMGERFKVTGDFNGDSIIDTVYESYISAISGRETYMDMDTTDWEENIKMIIDNKPVSRLYTSIKGVDTFVVTNDPQLRGLLRLENLGKINGENSDKLGYVINWADFSNINSYHIIALSQNKWEEIYSFPINEAVNFQPENLFDGKHIVKVLPNGQIKYKYYNDNAEVSDSVISLVSLK